MEFEPMISKAFEPGIQIGLNLFEPDPSNRNGHLTVRHLTGILTDSLKRIRARNGKPVFARSGLPLRAPAQDVFVRWEGGSK
jgi:hypothetical protein